MEDEMVGWHHQLNGHEFEQTLRDSEGQGSLVCCSPWRCKELDMTEWLNNSNNKKVNLKLSRETGVPRHQKSGSAAYCRCPLVSHEPSTILCFWHAPALLWGLAHPQLQTHDLGGGMTVTRLWPLTGGSCDPNKTNQGPSLRFFSWSWRRTLSQGLWIRKELKLKKVEGRKKEEEG